MAASPPQQIERQSLCEAMIRVGPNAPTLCEGWTAQDLAVHLVVRERHLLAAAGILLNGPFARILHDTSDRVGRRPFDDLVRTVRQGPPLWMRPADRYVNLVEYFVHHEDVRRANGETAARPAGDTVELQDALWAMLRVSARLATRSLGPVGLTVVRTGGASIIARRGTPSATLSGDPGELTLFLTGRGDAAHVELAGPSEAVDAVRAATFGL